MILTLNRESLLYDIGNYAYIAGHRLEMEEGSEQVAHLLTDICADGNVDRVSRVLATIHAALVAVLSPRSTDSVLLDNGIYEPDEYVIEIDESKSLSLPEIQLLSRLIHEYMVYRVIADWLSITHPKYAATWEEKANALYAEIIGTTRGFRPTIRRSSPIG